MIETLKADVANRDQNIAFYKLNIDKYERILAKLEDGSMPEFAKRITELLGTEREQCAIEQITRDVTAEILAELEAK